jgi:hypothetical protein
MNIPCDWQRDCSFCAPQGIKQNEQLYFGPFPARDNDGQSAITLVLPDKDGVVRQHPH